MSIILNENYLLGQMVAVCVEDHDEGELIKVANSKGFWCMSREVKKGKKKGDVCLVFKKMGDSPVQQKDYKIIDSMKYPPDILCQATGKPFNH